MAGTKNEEVWAKRRERGGGVLQCRLTNNKEKEKRKAGEAASAAGRSIEVVCMISIIPIRSVRCGAVRCGAVRCGAVRCGGLR